MQPQLITLLVALLVAGQVTANSVAHQEHQSNSVSSSSVESSQSAVQSPSSPVVEQPSVQQAPPAVVASGPAVAPVESHHSVVQHQQQQHPSVVSYYAPAALMQVVGAEQQAGQKPVALRNQEQYGQPESTGLPPNYKPFGSWGLYIGGNPADGYYTNYYKALSNSVDKQAALSGEQQLKPVVSSVSPAGPVSATAALSPVLRQASSSPYVGGDYFPFAYSTSDLSSASAGSPVPHVPVQLGSPVSSVESPVYGAPTYADFYATKKLGQSFVQKEVAKEQNVAPKGQSRVYVYPSGVGQLSGASVVGLQSPTVQHQAVGVQHQAVGVQHQAIGAQPQNPASHHQVVAYPVPVGSQIVGSQAGVDGAFAPYGVHAFTRYAVKPTVVSQEPSYSYSYQTVGQQVPVYRQHYAVPSVASSHYPYFGYPVNQLHYSQEPGVPVSAHHSSEVTYHGAPGPVVENVVVESEESKPQYNKPQ